MEKVFTDDECDDLIKSVTGIDPKIEEIERLKSELSSAINDERLRCAERYRIAHCPLIHNGRTVRPESCQECTKMLGPRYCDEVASILDIKQDIQ